MKIPDYMDAWENLFKKSMEQDRGFATSPAAWERMARALNQVEQTKRPGRWWIPMLVSMGLLVGVYIIAQHEDQRVNLSDQKSEAVVLSPDPIAIPSPQTEKSLVAAAVISGETKEAVEAKTPEMLVAIPPIAKSISDTLTAVAGPTGSSSSANTHQHALALRQAPATDTLTESAARLQNTIPELAEPTAISPRLAVDLGHNGTTKQISLLVLPRVAPVYLTYPQRSLPYSPERATTTPSRKIGAEWQLSLSAGQLLYSSPRNLDYYTPTPGGQSPTRVYTFPNGDTLGLDFAGLFPLAERTSLRFIRADLHRVFRSGVGVKAGLLYSYERDDLSQNTEPLDQINDVFYFAADYQLDTWSVELGIDYTFWRHRRIQPRVGFTSLLVLQSTRSEQRYALIPGQNYRNLEFSGRDVADRAFLGIYTEVGVQWLITKQWSVGPELLIVGFPGAGSSFRAAASVALRYRWE